MSGTFLLGSLFGIKVRIHFSWIFIFVLVAWLLATSELVRRFPDWPLSTRLAVGVIESALLFTSVLVHEFSHSLVAIWRGHAVSSITLFFLGGVSEIEGESRSAYEEFLISFVGPLTSIVLAGVIWIIAIGLLPQGSPPRAVAEYLALMNLVLGIFNLIPAYPLDGGRVLKALVWKATGSEVRATSIASLAGSVLGFTFVAFGIYTVIFQQSFFGLWYVFIGWFIQSAASSARRTSKMDRVLSGKSVRDAMRVDVPTVPPGLTVDTFLNEHVMKDFERAYVVGFGEAIQGLITLGSVRAIPVEFRSRQYITEVMVKPSDVVSVGPDEPLESALEALVKTGYHQLVVIENGRAIGMVTRGDVMRVLEISELFPSETPE